MIAILGGTFDPIHKGHLHIASRVHQLLSVEQVQFMPCAVPVHRAPPQASPEQRCDMIALGIAGDDRFALNRMEIERNTPSFTIDSLRELRAKGHQKMILILGSDAFNVFGTWKQPQEVLELAHIVVCLRPGEQLKPGCFDSHRVDSAAPLQVRSSGSILVLEVDAPNCASSSLRQRLAASLPVDDCLAAPVVRYIESCQLYQ